MTKSVPGSFNPPFFDLLAGLVKKWGSLMDDAMIETIMLTDDRYLGVAWKEGRVHSMCIATTQEVALKVTEASLRQKPIANDVYANIAKMIKLLPA